MQARESSKRGAICRPSFRETFFGWGAVTLVLAAVAASSVASGQTGTKLFNGWTITPAGTMIPLDHLEAVVQDPEFRKPAGGMTSDLPLKMIVSPDGKVLLAACAGYNNTGLAVIDLASKKVVQFFPLPQVWNGLAFSRDGKRVFLAGGSSGTIHVFNYENGKLTPGKAVKPVAKTRKRLPGRHRRRSQVGKALRGQRGQPRDLGPRFPRT